MLCVTNCAENPRQGNKDNRPGSRPHGNDILMRETATNMEANK